MAKISKFRWTAGSVQREDLVGVDPTNAIWDCGYMMAANEDWVAVPWAATGSTVVLKAGLTGKMAAGAPKLVGHSGAVLEVSFNPFHKDLVFTGGEDSTIRAWRIPEGGVTSDISTATAVLQGHNKKVGILSWHPSAENVLASVGMDHVINLWDVTAQAPKLALKQQDQQTSLNWNLDGTLLNTTCKDKQVYIFDSRTGAVAAQAAAHPGSKVQRSVWAKRRGLIVTVGFNRQQYRQMMVWDPRSLEKPVHTHEIDQNSAIMMPFIDEDTGLLYIAGKGDNDIKYFDLWRESTPVVPVNSFTAPDQIRALCMAPKSVMKLKECELARFYVMSNKIMRTISFNLPRRQGATQFQEDLYPPTFANQPALTCDEFFAGKNAAPNETDFSATFEGGAAVTKASSTGGAATSSPPPAAVASKQSESKAPAAVPAESKPAVVAAETPAPPVVPKAETPVAAVPVEQPQPVVEEKKSEQEVSTEFKPASSSDETEQQQAAGSKQPEAAAPVELSLAEQVSKQKAKVAALEEQLARETSVLKELEEKLEAASENKQDA